MSAAQKEEEDAYAAQQKKIMIEEDDRIFSQARKRHTEKIAASVGECSQMDKKKKKKNPFIDDEAVEIASESDSE